MCGITGFVAPRFSDRLAMEEVIRRMARQLQHRGPDDEGAWVDAEAGVALAHRRLAIIDLSSAGRQPMLSACGRYCIVFNGEIYNHNALRKELPDTVQWRGHSDTETLLSAISVWGLERVLKKAVGMFALTLWDRMENTLILARDRMGEKPLYYGFHGGALLFASELKALRAYPGFIGEVDRQALTLLLRHGAIPTPYSIYKGIHKLLSGSWLKLSLADIATGRLPVPQAYWSLDVIAQAGQQNQFSGSNTEAANELEVLLRQSISGQMLADVPLGAFLSGGIDSSAVVALMQAQSSKPVKTFSIGFHERDYNEAEHARAVASHLGTEHTEFYVTPDHALSVITRLPFLYDEPFADVSQIPTFLISELAQRHVKVCLSGDGGDELFGGYNRHITGARLWRRMGWIPRVIRTTLASSISSIAPSTWDVYFKSFEKMLPYGWRVRTPANKLQKVAEMLPALSSEEVYLRLVSRWSNPEQVVLGSMHSVCYPLHQNVPSLLAELEHQMMLNDSLAYLPDDILVKVDRAAMGVSLETRVPMLDHRVVEFAWRLPLEMKISGNQGKILLRQVLDRYVPRSLMERPKAGFAIPLDSWLRGPLKDWAEDLLDRGTLQDQGYFDPTPIREKWEEHLIGRHNWSSQLWGVLMFQAWIKSL